MGLTHKRLCGLTHLQRCLNKRLKRTCFALEVWAREEFLHGRAIKRLEMLSLFIKLGLLAKLEAKMGHIDHVLYPSTLTEQLDQ